MRANHTLKVWRRPVLTEIAVGLEINAYASAQM